MPTTTPTTQTTRAPTTERATVARAAALVLALGWSTLGFATTDLWVVIPPPHPLFAGEHAMLEAGWGVTMTCLVVVPLLAMVLRPGLGRAVAVQVTVLAACAVPAGLLALDVAVVLFGATQLLTAGIVAWVAPGRRRRRGGRRPDGSSDADPRRLVAVWSVVTLAVFVGLPWVGFMRTSGSYYPDGSRNGAILLAATIAAAWGLAWLVRRPAAPRPVPDRWRRHVPLLAVVAAGSVPWLLYVWHLTAEARSPGHVPYLTNSVDHWPQQAAAALALVVLPAAAVAGLGSVRLAGWTAGLSAVGLGGFSLLYPDVGASLGPAWGVLAMVWGVGVVVASAAHPDERPPALVGGRPPAVGTPS